MPGADLDPPIVDDVLGVEICALPDIRRVVRAVREPEAVVRPAEKRCGSSLESAVSREKLSGRSGRDLADPHAVGPGVATQGECESFPVGRQLLIKDAAIGRAFEEDGGLSRERAE